MFTRFSFVVQEFGFFILRRITRFSFTSIRENVFLVVYVDDIVFTGDNVKGISDVKSYLHQKFQLKHLGPLRYIPGIEVARPKEKSRFPDKVCVRFVIRSKYAQT